MVVYYTPLQSEDGITLHKLDRPDTHTRLMALFPGPPGQASTRTVKLVLDRVRHFRPIPIHRFFAVNRIRYRYDTDFLIHFKSGRGAA